MARKDSLSQERVKRLRYAGRILALVWAVGWTIYGLVTGISQGEFPFEAFMHVAVPGLIFLIGSLIAWFWEWVGGVLIIFASLVAILWYANFAPEWISPGAYVTVMLLLAAPPVAAVVCFMVCQVRTYLRESHP